MALTVVAILKAKKGMEAEVEAELQSLIGPTRREPGCLNYDLHQLNDDPAVCLFHENWKSKEDLDQHLAMPYLQKFQGRAEELLAEPVDLKLLTKIG